MKIKKLPLIFFFLALCLFPKNAWAQGNVGNVTITGPDGWKVRQIPINAPAASIKNLGDLVSAGVTTVIVIAGLLTFLYLVWGGIEWLTSGGDKDKYEAARNRITAALIGLAIISASWALMQLISHFFGIDITVLNIPSAVKP